MCSPTFRIVEYSDDVVLSEKVHFYSSIYYLGGIDGDNYLVVIEYNGEVMRLPLSLRETALRFPYKKKILYKYKYNAAVLIGVIKSDTFFRKIYPDLVKFLFRYFGSITVVKVESLVDKKLEEQDIAFINSFIEYRPWGARAFPIYDFTKIGDSKEIDSLVNKKLRKRIRKLESDHHEKIEIVKFPGDFGLEKYIVDAECVSEASWQYENFGQRLRFTGRFVQALKKAYNDGVLKSYILYVGDTPIAFCLRYLFNHVYYCEESGFNKKFVNYSPGSILNSHIMIDLYYNTDTREVHWGPGQSEHKTKYSNGSYFECEKIIFKRFSFGTVMFLLHYLFMSLSRYVKKKSE